MHKALFGLNDSLFINSQIAIPFETFQSTAMVMSGHRLYFMGLLPNIRTS